MSDGDLEIRRDVVIPADELVVTTSHSGGPGGQNVNKVATKVILRWNIRESVALGPTRRERLLTKLASRLTTAGELVLHVDEHRSQGRNRELARERLVELVRESLVVPKARRKTKPTKGSKKRRLAQKKRRGDVKKMRRPPSDS